MAEAGFKTLKVKRTEEAKRFPLMKIAKYGDVGYDLPACLPNGSITIEPHTRGIIPTGIHLEIPHGYWASIEARSSTSKQMLICPKGVIDEGYRGELFAVLINVGNEPVVINDGDRYVQLILHERLSSEFLIREVDELTPSERGDSGFGSTGRK
jgi:dUTP pyrophosphatase